MTTRRSFLRALLPYAAIIAMAPRLCFRVRDEAVIEIAPLNVERIIDQLYRMKMERHTVRLYSEEAFMNSFFYGEPIPPEIDTFEP